MLLKDGEKGFLSIYGLLLRSLAKLSLVPTLKTRERQLLVRGNSVSKSKFWCKKQKQQRASVFIRNCNFQIYYSCNIGTKRPFAIAAKFSP
jgi:hypothetical protein